MAKKKAPSDMNKAELYQEVKAQRARADNSSAANRQQRIDNDPVYIDWLKVFGIGALIALAIIAGLILANSKFPGIVSAREDAAIAAAADVPDEEVLAVVPTAEDTDPAKDLVAPADDTNDDAAVVDNSDGDLVPASDDLSAIVIRCFDYRGTSNQTPNVCEFGEEHQALWEGSSGFPVTALLKWAKDNSVATVDFNVKDLSRSLTFNPKFVNVSMDLASAIYGDDASNHLWYVNTDGVGSHTYDSEMSYQFFEIYDSSYIVLQ